MEADLRNCCRGLQKIVEFLIKLTVSRYILMLKLCNFA